MASLTRVCQQTRLSGVGLSKADDSYCAIAQGESQEMKATADHSVCLCGSGQRVAQGRQHLAEALVLGETGTQGALDQIVVRARAKGDGLRAPVDVLLAGPLPQALASQALEMKARSRAGWPGANLIPWMKPSTEASKTSSSTNGHRQKLDKATPRQSSERKETLSVGVDMGWSGACSGAAECRHERAVYPITGRWAWACSAPASIEAASR
ncbi:hypothetical protein CCAE64S_00194 [Castellaniella caeni]